MNGEKVILPFDKINAHMDFVMIITFDHNVMWPR